MRFNSRHLALIAVTASAIAPAAAGARPLPADHPSSHDAGVTCGKDYSRNSVSGDYCQPSTSGSASISTRSTSTPPQVVTKHDNSFAWGDAGAGAGGALALVLIAGGGAIAVRRRHGSSTVGQRRSPATG